MRKKRIAIALGHDALGTTLPEQQKAAKKAAKAIADLVQDDCEIVITHSNGPQVGMIPYGNVRVSQIIYGLYSDADGSLLGHEPGVYRIRPAAGDPQRTDEPGVYRTVSTLLTQVVVDPYDDAFYHPTKVIGRVMSEEEARRKRKRAIM